MRRLIVLLTVLAVGPAAPDAFQSPPPPPNTSRDTPITPEQLQSAINRLGTVDYAVRTAAARAIRRAPAATVVPALIDAATRHADGYVRFRALVLLSGFNDPRTHAVMVQALGEKNDRLRAVGYGWFEHNRDPQLVSRMLDALAREDSEFVRPALTRRLTSVRVRAGRTDSESRARARRACGPPSCGSRLCSNQL